MPNPDVSWHEYIIGEPFKPEGARRKYARIECKACDEIVETRLDHIKKRIWEGTSLYCRSCSSKRTYVDRTIDVELEDWQWAYLAGFLDGEGSLSWGGGSTTPQLTIAQCDRAPLDIIDGWLGIAGEMFLDKKSEQNPAWRDCWHWRITNVIDILWLLCQINKYLLVKTEWLGEVVAYLDQRVDLNGYEELLEYARSLLSR